MSGNGTGTGTTLEEIRDANPILAHMLGEGRPPIIRQFAVLMLIECWHELVAIGEIRLPFSNVVPLG